LERRETQRFGFATMHGCHRDPSLCFGISQLRCACTPVIWNAATGMTRLGLPHCEEVRNVCPHWTQQTHVPSAVNPGLRGARLAREENGAVGLAGFAFLSFERGRRLAPGRPTSIFKKQSAFSTQPTKQLANSNWQLAQLKRGATEFSAFTLGLANCYLPIANCFG
jgi:hypothetical protein